MSIGTRPANSPPTPDDRPEPSPPVPAPDPSEAAPITTEQQPDGTLVTPPPNAGGQALTAPKNAAEHAPTVAGSGVTEPAAQPAITFGDYILLDKIAEGGMGLVYRARQVSLNRVVALKMVARGVLATAADLARFRVEAEAAAALDHPHIVTVYGFGEHCGQPYFSMRYIPGGSLAGLLRANGPLGARPAAELMAKVAAAVHHAHRHRLLHRDLKPGNILLSNWSEPGTEADPSVPATPTVTLPPSGGELTPFVADFGLAKRLGTDDGATRTGAMMGTPSYMSPEQARGSKNLTAAADVYSLGAILYECLTGRPPFRGADPFDTARLVIDSAPPDPQTFNPAADPVLCAIALKCLEKEPTKRYAGADTLAADLGCWLQGTSTKARPAKNNRTAARWLRQPAAPIGLAACVLMTAALLAPSPSITGMFGSSSPGGLTPVTATPPELGALSARPLFDPGVVRSAGDQVTLDLPGRAKMAFVWCPPGEFQMGGQLSEEEKPAHEVTLTRGFFIGRYEVTQGEWKAVMGSNPSKFKHGSERRPVEQVSWYDAKDFCDKVREANGVSMRLPTEAEWEYACRAGTTGEYHWGDVPSTKDMNYDYDSSWRSSAKAMPLCQTYEVGKFACNPWGIYDMHGNLWEWCEDHGDRTFYHRSPSRDPNNQDITPFRIVRGGSFWVPPQRCRAAFREFIAPNLPIYDIGFRVCFAVH